MQAAPSSDKRIILTLSDILERLKAHEVWIKSGEHKGKQLTFANVDFARSIDEQQSTTGAILHRTVFQGRQLGRAQFINCDLTGFLFHSAQLDGAEFHGSVLDSCVFDNALARESKFLVIIPNEVTFKGSDLEGASFADSFLFKADFTDARLSGAIFDRATLDEVSFWGATCTDASFEEATIIGVSFSRTILQKVSFEGAKIYSLAGKGADLSGIVGHPRDFLAGQDTTAMKLPEHLEELKGVEVARGYANNAKKIHAALAIGCAYSILTICTTPDLNLLTNSSSSALPIINVPLPIVGFYVVAPIVLLGTFIYTLIYLQHLWKSLAELPAIFPDGRPVDVTVSTWLPVSLIRSHSEVLQSHRTMLYRLSNAASRFLLWWMVPLTMLAFWLGAQPRHDDLLSTFLMYATLGSYAVSMVSYLTTVSIFMRNFRIKHRHDESISSRSSRFRALLSLVSEKVSSFNAFLMESRVVYFDLLVITSICAILLTKDLVDRWGSLMPTELTSVEQNVLIPALSRATLSPYADLFQSNLSPRFADTSLAAIFLNTQLSNADLRYANGKNSLLRGQDFRGTSFDFSDFSNSWFEQVEFSAFRDTGWKLTHTAFVQCNADSGSQLTACELDSASLTACELDFLQISSTSMRRANFNHCELTDAAVLNCDLSYALFDGCNFNYAKFHDCTMRFSHFADCHMIGGSLSKCSLEKARFKDCCFVSISFEGSILLQTQFESPIGLSADSLNQAAFLDTSVVLPKAIRDSINFYKPEWVKWREDNDSLYRSILRRGR